MARWFRASIVGYCQPNIWVGVAHHPFNPYLCEHTIWNVNKLFLAKESRERWDVFIWGRGTPLIYDWFIVDSFPSCKMTRDIVNCPGVSTVPGRHNLWDKSQGFQVLSLSKFIGGGCDNCREKCGPAGGIRPQGGFRPHHGKPTQGRHEVENLRVGRYSKCKPAQKVAERWETLFAGFPANVIWVLFS